MSPFSAVKGDSMALSKWLERTCYYYYYEHLSVISIDGFCRSCSRLTCSVKFTEAKQSHSVCCVFSNFPKHSLTQRHIGWVIFTCHVLHVCFSASCLIVAIKIRARTHACTHARSKQFYGSLDFVRDNPGEPVPEETFTHSNLSWSSIIPICFLHLLRSMTSSLFNLHALKSFSTISVQVLFGLLLGLAPSTSYYYCCYYYYYSRLTAHWILSGTTRVSHYQKGKTKTILDFLQEEKWVAMASARPYANLHLDPDI